MIDPSEVGTPRNGFVKRDDDIVTCNSEKWFRCVIDERASMYVYVCMYILNFGLVGKVVSVCVCVW